MQDLDRRIDRYRISAGVRTIECWLGSDFAKPPLSAPLLDLCPRRPKAMSYPREGIQAIEAEHHLHATNPTHKAHSRAGADDADDAPMERTHKEERLVVKEGKATHSQK